MEIFDFCNVIVKFKDFIFDGDFEFFKGGGKKFKLYKIIDGLLIVVFEFYEKYIINGKDICIVYEIVFVLGEDGKMMRIESI